MNSIRSTSTVVQNGSDGPGDRPIRWFFGVPFRPRRTPTCCTSPSRFRWDCSTSSPSSPASPRGRALDHAGRDSDPVSDGARRRRARSRRGAARDASGRYRDPLPTAFRADNPRSLLRAEDGYADALAALVTAPTTWTSFVLVFLKFVYGVLAFTVLVVSVSIVTAMLAAPLVYSDPHVSYVFGQYQIETLPAALAVAALGVVGGFVSFHLWNVLAMLGGVLNAVLLGAFHDEPGVDGGDVDGLTPITLASIRATSARLTSVRAPSMAMRATNASRSSERTRGDSSSESTVGPTRPRTDSVVVTECRYSSSMLPSASRSRKTCPSKRVTTTSSSCHAVGRVSPSGRSGRGTRARSSRSRRER